METERPTYGIAEWASALRASGTPNSYVGYYGTKPTVFGYLPECVEGLFSELRLEGVLESSHRRASDGASAPSASSLCGP